MAEREVERGGAVGQGPDGDAVDVPVAAVTSETKEDPDAGAGTAQLANGDGCPLKADV